MDQVRVPVPYGLRIYLSVCIGAGLCLFPKACASISLCMDQVRAPVP